MRCITIINYKLEDQPIFCVNHLSDRAFNAGFRVLNPDFNTTSRVLEEDYEELKELLNTLDEQDEFVPNLKFNSTKARDRFLTKYQDHDWRSTNG